MGEGTHIQWTEATWNPTIGCTRVSAGCDNCYAFALHDRRHVAWKRGQYPKAPRQYHQPFSVVQLLPGRLVEPLRWRRPRLVFVNSMSDLFHEQVSDAFIEDVWTVMSQTPQHTFQVLTKRPRRLEQLLNDPWFVEQTTFVEGEGPDGRWGEGRHPWPLPNVWLGVSVEDQQRAEERIPPLLQTPAAVRFVSAEPLLGAVDLRPWLRGAPALDWVIVGGESGARARPCRLDWVRGVVRQCREAGVPVFVKQLGSRPVGGAPLRLRDRKGGDPSEWPADLRVREWPGVRRG